MARTQKSLTIKAPVDRVFRFLEDKSRLPEIWPSMLEVRDESVLPNGGKKYHWTYKMIGLRFEGDTEETEFVRNQRLVARSTGGLETTMAWTFEPHDGTTDVRFEADYRIPVPLLDRLAEPLITRMNENEAELVLRNLRTLMEDPGPG